LKQEENISQLNWALNIYSDIVKYGSDSSVLDESEECLHILEQFEEYEKCSDILHILKDNEPGILFKLSKKKRKK
jgi:hypothetical protein